MENKQEKVVVVDFGAQYGQLIARRVRDLKVYSEIVPYTTSAQEILALKPDAIILSGGPASVYLEDSPHIDPEILDLGLPILGFCYGMQTIAYLHGGKVANADKGEYGGTRMQRLGESQLLAGTPEEQTVWMSHRDSVTQVPEGYTLTASTPNCPVAAFENPEKKIYATQFHPEVKHTSHGNDILKTFLFELAGLSPQWTTESVIDRAVREIREQVKDEHVILALSGGVDSSVVAALLHKAIGDQLHCVFVNHGLLRKGEPESVERVFKDQFKIDLKMVDAQDRYLNKLAGVNDPEKKRRIIGEEFWKVFFEEAQKLDGIRYLAQGTIYPDVIESGSRKTGGASSTIKSHHNLIPFPEGVHFDLIEPLDHFFKDEVRAIGTELGLPDEIVYRQPFPGPGLAIRIIGDITKEKLDLLREADAIVREELDAYNKEHEGAVWQYFAVLPDIRSVGVMGDERTYARPIIIRAVESQDAMTADWAKLPYEVLSRISSRIVGEVAGINRVAYDITSKPPATIEWE
ncbi:MAG: glutamine-hydrolyzing GMP synthase [Coriobacteriia bacterium]|nr:glutamine-hydrolyzing GMP synthase [Coriobacteriia bacterium]